MPEPKVSEAFLSHAGKDHAKASRLRKILLAHAVPVWYSPHHITGGQQWQDEIGEALARCDWFLLLLTPNAVESKWVRFEVGYALSKSRYDERIVPLLFKECDSEKLSWTLPQIQMIDFTRNYHEACKQLLQKWEKTFHAKLTKPPKK